MVLPLGTGEPTRMFAGRCDVGALAGGAERFPWTAVVEGAETSVMDSRSLERFAWYPQALRFLTTHPGGRMWAGSAGNTLHLIQLEGLAPGPNRPSPGRLATFLASSSDWVHRVCYRRTPVFAAEAALCLLLVQVCWSPGTHVRATFAVWALCNVSYYKILVEILPAAQRLMLSLHLALTSLGAKRQVSLRAADFQMTPRPRFFWITTCLAVVVNTPLKDLFKSTF
jgi:hypothetical protein